MHEGVSFYQSSHKQEHLEKTIGLLETALQHYAGHLGTLLTTT
jgi:hypothetical protein